ncbi:MAG: glycosyltransferase [Proteobacteria bacterium]|nr:glycosyltransferase [Pseudomonadota bacterium]
MRGLSRIAWLGREAVFAAGVLARMVYEHLPEPARRLAWRWLRGRRAPAMPASTAPLSLAARDRAILVIDAHTPRLGQDAASLATIELLRAVEDLGYAARFAAVEGPAYAGGDSEALRQAGVATIHPPEDRSLADHLRRAGEGIAAVVLVRHGVARRWLEPIRRALPGRPVLFLDADLHSLREARRAEVADSPVLAWSARRTKRLELSVIDRVDATIVHSPVERDLILEERPKVRVQVWVWPVEPKPTPKPFELRRDLVFLGGYRHTSNLDGARWFVGSVLPLIRRDLPDLCLRLVGSNPSRALADLAGEGVVVVGPVDDLSQEFGNARLFVAPLRYGAGLKGKVLDAVAFGLPTVLTSIAAEGSGFEHELDTLIADTPVAFAEAVSRLYRDADLWARLREASLRRLGRSFSRQVQTKSLAELFIKLDLPVN